MSYKKKAVVAEENFSLKLTADKIIEKLNSQYNLPKTLWRRWAWELLQNAKDLPVPEAFKGVTVQFELSAEELVFRHNGNPFSIDNVMALIRQVSSKPSDSSDEEKTGKFGTGFITTHLLSEVIQVKGVLAEKDETPRGFHLELDRSATTSEEMIPKIREARRRILEDIENDSVFPPRTEYPAKRKESDLDTVFEYRLKTPEAEKAATDGIADLEQNLPLTMAFLPQIKVVKVINHVEGRTLRFECKRLKKEGAVSQYQISITENGKKKPDRRNFLVYSQGELDLATEVSSFDKIVLMPKREDQALLFRDFPLIGSEKFHLPFILNGKRLFPTETRDSLLLNGNKHDFEYNQNLLKSSFEAALLFIDWLVEKGAKGFQHVIQSRLPDFKFDAEWKTWYIDNLQKPFRKGLLEKLIVDTENGMNSLSKVWFPYHGEIRENWNEFWKVCAPYQEYDTVPKQGDLAVWIEALGPEDELDAWELRMRFTIRDLAESIKKDEKMAAITLDQSHGNKGLTVVAWLNSYYKFLDKVGEMELLKEYAIVPNRNQDLLLYERLWAENQENPLPESLLDILKRLGPDWRAELVHQSLKIPGEGHQSRSLSDLNTAINDILNHKEKVANGPGEYSFLKQVGAIDILLDIHRIVPLKSGADSFQRKLLEKAEALFGATGSLIPIKQHQEFNFEIANRLLIICMNDAISNCDTVEVLKERLGLGADETIDWLNQYMLLLDGSKTFRQLLQDSFIFPNRYGEFCGYNELFNYGTASQRLEDELLELLKKLSAKEDWFKDLLAENISIQLPNTKTFEELGVAITNELRDITDGSTYEAHRSELLELVSWARKFSNLCQSYLPYLYINSSTIFMALTINNPRDRERIMRILSNPDRLESLARLAENTTDIENIERLLEIFPKGIPANVMQFAEEEGEKKRDFDYRLEIGSEVERLFKEGFEKRKLKLVIERVDNENIYMVHAGSGPYDFRVHNPDNGNDFYIEMKSVANGNTFPVKLAISQLERATKELHAYCLAVIERPANKKKLDVDYVMKHLKFVEEPGSFLGSVLADHRTVISNTSKKTAAKLEMVNGDFRAAIEYEFLRGIWKDLDAMIDVIVEELGD